MRQAFLVVSVILVASFAGRVSQAPAAVPTPSPGPGPSADAAPGTRVQDEAPSEPESVAVAFNERGRLETGAQVCVPESASHCQAVGGAPFFSLEGWLDGPMTQLRAVVSWSAASAATESLEVVLGGCVGSEEDHSCEQLASGSGASPLEVSAGSMASPWNYYYVLVMMPSTATDEHARASPGQDVLVEGGLTWLRRPA